MLFIHQFAENSPLFPSDNFFVYTITFTPKVKAENQGTRQQ